MFVRVSSLLIDCGVVSITSQFLVACLLAVISKNSIPRWKGINLKRCIRF